MSAAMDALLAEVRDRLAALENALAGLSNVRARFACADCSVVAEVDGDGALTGLWLSESVTSRAPEEVSRAIVRACREAAALASAQRAEVVSRLNDSLTTRHDGKCWGQPG